METPRMLDKIVLSDKTTAVSSTLPSAPEAGRKTTSSEALIAAGARAEVSTRALALRPQARTKGRAVKALFTPVKGLNDRRSQTGFMAAFLATAVDGGQRVVQATMGTGSGKTAAGISAAQSLLALWPDEVALGVPLSRRRGVRLAIVLVPNGVIKASWRDEGARFGKLDPTSRLQVWCPSSKDLLSCSRLPDRVADRTVLLCSVQGIQPSEVASAMRALIAGKDGEVVVITDETHHLSHGNTWGATIDAATENARYRIGLSGTPYRHDDGAILDACPVEGFKPDYHYSKTDALEDGVVARLIFKVVDGAIDHGSALDPATAPVRLSECEEAKDGLRAALRPGSPFLASLLEDAMAELAAVRERMGEVEPGYRAAGAIKCSSIRQLNWIRAFLEARGAQVKVTHSRDGAAGDEVIARFNAGEGDWLLAVERLTEGLNIKRLRVGVYLSRTTTQQSFEQFGGRVERLLDGIPPDDQDGLIIVPHFPAFVRYAGEYERAIKDVEVRRKLPAAECVCCRRIVPATLAACPYCQHARAMSNPSVEHDGQDRLLLPEERTAVALGSTIVVGDIRLSEEMVQAAARRFDDRHCDLRAQTVRWLPDLVKAALQHHRDLQDGA